MGWTLPSHMDSGLIFGLLGLWHVCSVLHLYISDPQRFKSRAWFPAPLPGLFRALELWILLVIVLIFIMKQLSHATVDLASGVIHTEHLMRFQHVAFSVMYLVYLSVALFNENFKAFPLPGGVLQATFALGFLSELIVFHFGHHPGDDLESYVHMLMQLILASLVTLMFLEIRHPTSIVLALARSMCLVFKGTWFFYIGCLINIPSCVPLGCSMEEGHDFPSCNAPTDNMRAKALQVLIFIAQLVAIVVSTFVSYGTLSWALGGTESIASYTEVANEMTEDAGHVYFVVDSDKEFATEALKAGVPLLKDLPRSLSKRLSNKNIIPSTPVVTDSRLAVFSPTVPLAKTVLMVSSPLPKNIKNV